MLEIKPILPNHWPLVKDLRLRMLADAPAAFGTTLAEADAYSDDQWQARARRFSEPPSAAGCIAYWSGVPCGMANGYGSEDDPQAAGLTGFWVAPDFRGRGVAEAMTGFVADWAAARGFAALHAEVVEDNHRALAFYNRFGFEETGQSQPFRGNPAKRILLMAKDLKEGKAWD